MVIKVAFILAFLHWISAIGYNGVPIYQSENFEEIKTKVEEFKGKGYQIAMTHNGNFHCDDIMACALLKYTSEFPKPAFIRTRNDEALELADITLDVGKIYNSRK